MVSGDPPAPAGLRDAPRAAWIIAAAFADVSRLAGARRWRWLGVLHAAAAWPLAASLAATAAVRGALYVGAERSGVVCLGPQGSRSGPSVVAPVSITWTAIGTPLVVGPILLGLPPAALAACFTLFAGLMFVGFEPYCPRSRPEPEAVAGPVPKGPRWQATMLAQLPGAQSEAPQLARSVIRELVPRGSVVIATPRTAELEGKYLALGFRRVDGGRVAYVAKGRT